MMKNQDKAQIRAKYRAIRKDVCFADEKSASIADKLFEFLSTLQYGSVFIYQSLDGEVQTEKIISALCANKDVFVPKVIDKTMRLCHISTEECASDCDVSIVPLIAFDCQNYRLGFGGGYYDRFLCTSSSISIGLAFDEQFCEELPVLPHDVPLDYIITPTKIYKRGGK